MNVEEVQQLKELFSSRTFGELLIYSACREAQQNGRIHKHVLIREIQRKLRDIGILFSKAHIEDVLISFGLARRRRPNLKPEAAEQIIRIHEEQKCSWEEAVEMSGIDTTPAAVWRYLRNKRRVQNEQAS